MHESEKIFYKCIDKNYLSELLITNNFGAEINNLIKYRLSTLNSLDIRRLTSTITIDNFIINYKDLQEQLLPSLFSISAILIVKNEEKNIKKCIDSIIEFVDEIIILDTGSQDNTINIIEMYSNSKINLFFYKWNNDFSGARNYAKSKANSNWIFFMDADEYIDTENISKLLNIINIFDKAPIKKSVIICIDFIEEGTQEYGSNLTRIFYNTPNLYYFGLVHEELRSTDTIIFIPTNITIHHTGYSLNHIKLNKKLNRNISLLKKMICIEKNNPRWIYFLSRDGFGICDNIYLEQIITNSIFLDNIISYNTFINKVYSLELLDLLARILLHANKVEKLKIVLKILHLHNPDSSNLLFYEVLSEIIKKKHEYQALLNKVTDYRKKHFGIQSGMISSNGYHIDLLIAILLFEVHDFDKANTYFKYLDDKLDSTFKKTYIDYYNILNK